MLLTDHTAGPWAVAGNDVRSVNADGLHGARVATLASPRDLPEWTERMDWSSACEEAQANAALIASAPDLLLELRKAVRAMEKLHAYLVKHQERLPPLSLASLEGLIESSSSAVAKAESR